MRRDLRKMTASSVDLWVAPEEIAHATVGAVNCRQLLTKEELLRESRIHHERDRALYRLGRALMRTVLSTYVDVEPLEWAFARSRFGRPRIAAPTGVSLEFSLAHTTGLALLLVSASAAIGVDVEHARRPIAAELPCHVFGRPEIDDLASRRGVARQRRFFEYWTLKEAYAKALGTGLSLPLDQCVFRIEAGWATALVQPEVESSPPEWWFSLPVTVPGYVAAVAVGKDGPDGHPPDLATYYLASLPASAAHFQR
jgi:4'-phosphopantetheinyl transferase